MCIQELCRGDKSHVWKTLPRTLPKLPTSREPSSTCPWVISGLMRGLQSVSYTVEAARCFGSLVRSVDRCYPPAYDVMLVGPGSDIQFVSLCVLCSCSVGVQVLSRNGEAHANPITTLKRSHRPITPLRDHRPNLRVQRPKITNHRDRGVTRSHPITP